jgi:hypothetical protein
MKLLAITPFQRQITEIFIGPIVAGKWSASAVMKNLDHVCAY